MSEEFLKRLRQNQLTNIEDYQRMKKALSEMKSEDDATKNSSEDWKTWQLLPISAGDEVKSEPGLIDSSSDTARGVHRAISILDQKG